MRSARQDAPKTLASPTPASSYYWLATRSLQENQTLSDRRSLDALRVPPCVDRANTFHGFRGRMWAIRPQAIWSRGRLRLLVEDGYRGRRAFTMATFRRLLNQVDVAYCKRYFSREMRPSVAGRSGPWSLERVVRLDTAQDTLGNEKAIAPNLKDPVREATGNLIRGGALRFSRGMRISSLSSDVDWWEVQLRSLRWPIAGVISIFAKNCCARLMSDSSCIWFWMQLIAWFVTRSVCKSV